MTLASGNVRCMRIMRAYAREFLGEGASKDNFRRFRWLQCTSSETLKTWPAILHGDMQSLAGLL